MSPSVCWKHAPNSRLKMSNVLIFFSLCVLTACMTWKKKEKKKVTVCVHARFSVPLHKSVGRERPAHPRRGRFGEALICTIQSFFFFFWGETERKMDVLMKWLKDYLLTCGVLYVNVGLWGSHAGGKRQIMDQSEYCYSHFQIYFMSLLWSSFALLIRH